MAGRTVVFRLHAVRRMLERGFTEQEVDLVLEHGEVLEAYPSDEPYPSRLLLGWSGSRPLHVVAAEHLESQTTFIITVYEPHTDEWEADFKRRKP